MSDWITDRLPTEDDVASSDGYCVVWRMYKGKPVTGHYRAVEDGEPWQHYRVPEPYAPPERVFHGGATYSKPGVWYEKTKGQLWKGPALPEGNLHFATANSVHQATGDLVWTFMASELPDQGDYVRIDKPVAPPKPSRREWTIFVDSNNNYIRFVTGTDEAVKVREVLPGDPTPEDLEKAATLLDKLDYTIIAHKLRGGQ